jgi:DNA mismatch repair protein MutS
VVRGEIRKELRSIQDLERLTSRITLGQAGPRELVALRKSLGTLPTLKNFVTPPPSGGSELLRRLHGEIDELADVREQLERAIADEPPALPADPGMIRAGFHGELDELRNLSQHSKQIIAAMEERERKRTGITSLKIRFNQVFGYYIEISKPNLHLAPADYERKQTLVNAERFTSPELKEYERKILAADERILEIERQLFIDIRSGIARKAARLRQTASAIAQLDALASFSKLAADRGYARPEFNDSGELLLVAARHPVIEELLRQKGERFVPNDLCFEPRRQQLLLITGPNMAANPPTFARPRSSSHGANGLLRSRAASQASDHRPHLHAHRRQRQSRPRPLHVPGRNVRGGFHPHPRHPVEPGAFGRSRPRHRHL